jgi:hypothetical protein
LNLKGLLSSTTIADKILFSLLIMLSFSGIVFIKEVLPEGREAQIEVNGRLVYILPMESNRMVTVEGPKGKTVIEIKDHRLRVTESPCRNKICIKQGWVESGAIVCLPNRVIITIGDGEHNKIVDAITG